jgi:hypothetical protein
MAKTLNPRLDQPALELRCGGLHLTIQRVPAWLITIITTATGTGAAWWTSR